MSTQPRSGWRALAVVAGVQGAVIALTAVLALVPLWVIIDLEAFQPSFYRFPLQASADASPPEVVREELASALPGARVELQGDSILLLGKRAELKMPVPLTVLTEHGYQPSTFSMGQVLDFEGGIRRTAASSSAPAMAFLLLLLPVVFAAVDFVLRRRTVLPWPPRRGVPASVLAGILAGLLLALAGLYAWSGSLWTPILAHATSNLIAVAGMLG